jgi:glycoside/pentoside/hexuronide:cation symporter, GPH family
MKRLQKIAYSVGSLGTALSFQAFTSKIQYFYIAVLKVDPRLLGVVWFFYGIWNAINDPLMGRLSDGTHSRLGRRIPYILFGSIPLALFFLFLWIPPRGNIVLLVGYFAVMVFAFDTLWTLVVLAWTALMPEMWPDLRDRAEVAGWREGFSVIGALAALGAAPFIIEKYGYGGMGIAFAVVTAVSFLTSILGSKEDPERHQDEESLPLMQGLRSALANRSFRWFLLANLGKEFLIIVVLAMLPFYADVVLGLKRLADGAAKESLLLSAPFVLSIPGMVVWTKITQRIGSRRAWLYASLAMIPGFAVMFFAPDFNVALIGVSLLALGLPGLLMMHNLVISDVIDEDEVIGGQRREGFFFGMNGAIIRLAFSWQALLTGTIPTLTGYNPNLSVQPEAAVWGFRFLTAGAPILGLLVTIYALTRYPLHGTALDTMRTKMLEMHAQASAD